MASAEEQEDFLLFCRYGDLDDVKTYLNKFGSDNLLSIRDDNGSNCLHMAAGNGHNDILDILLPLLPPEGLSEANSSLSAPLHWASLNKHLVTVQKLVNHTPGPGVNLIDQKNKAGRTPLGEAEMAGWEEGAQWMVSVMNLTTNSSAPTEEDGEDVEFDRKDIEVEIEDADGGIARMTLQSASKDATVTTPPPERDANAGSDAPA